MIPFKFFLKFQNSSFRTHLQRSEVRSPEQQNRDFPIGSSQPQHNYVYHDYVLGFIECTSAVVSKVHRKCSSIEHFRKLPNYPTQGRSSNQKSNPAQSTAMGSRQTSWIIAGLPTFCQPIDGSKYSPQLNPQQVQDFFPGHDYVQPIQAGPVVVPCRMHILPNIGPTGWPVDLLRCRTIAISSLQPVQYPSKNAQNSTVRKASHRNLQGQPNAMVVARPCNLPIIVPWFIQQKRTDGGFNLAFMRDTSAIDSRWLGQNRARMERGLKSSWTQHKDGIMMDRLGFL